ncbi:hypothetical protein ASF66_00830 [Pseudomonas sp. Leaf129]|uniref:hypothetical protein n=1 Tax=Pseudomonas sp. Leaf129 TaxID=1736268 RepID=UPI00070259C2|nr:hypothetical protein [Pseudomonas sp. Leaf129]KQQ62930.1 hypothetical protein ASF66_00830 [Pseudomonas sp. Leaf129]
MKTPLVDHLWTKIAERDGVARAVTEQKLQELKSIETAIALHDGAEAVHNVLAYGSIRRALERCLQYHQGAEDMDDVDMLIFYNYATRAAKEAEDVIDRELPYLGL